MDDIFIRTNSYKRIDKEERQNINRKCQAESVTKQYRINE